MAGWTVTFHSAGSSLTLPNAVEASMVPTDSATVAFVLGDGRGAESWALLVDYTDPLNAVYGTPTSLGAFGSDAALGYVVVPAQNQAIITRRVPAGGSEGTDYCVVTFDTATLSVTAVGTWTRLDPPTGYVDPSPYDQPLLAFSSTQLVATAQMFTTGFGGALTPIAVPLAFDGTSLTPGAAVVISVPGWMLSPVLNASVLYAVTASGQLVSITPTGAVTLVKDPTVEGDGTPASAFWRTGTDRGRLLRSLNGYYDVTLSTGAVGAFVAFSEPLAPAASTMGARSGDGTLDIVQGTSGFGHPAATFHPSDVHPRASEGGSGSGAWPTPLIPLPGPHALGLTNFGPDVQVGRLDETLEDRYAEADPHGSSSGSVGATMSADLAYDHFEWAGGPDRPPSSLYWRAVTSWQIDWGDGTSSSGAGPIWAEPNPSTPDVAFTLGHTYNRAGAFTVMFSVVDSLGQASTPNFTSVFTVTGATRLRQFPRDDYLGGSPRQGHVNQPKSTQSSARQGWVNAYR